MRACVQWYIAYWRDRAESRTNPARNESEELKSQYLRSKIGVLSGEFIPRREAMNDWTAGYLELGKFLDSIPSSVGRDLGLAPDVVRAIRERINLARANFVKDTGKYLNQEELANDKAVQAANAQHG